jgi:pyruvate, orthophosphate dikinase
VQARINGAEGIGLVRTEHMFFKTESRINAVRRMIFARDSAERTASLLPIEDFQREDFEGIFKQMDCLPVTIRLLDPPLHEFLPAHDNVDAIEVLAAEVGMSVDELQDVMERMQEVNPMLGFRGCRLAIAYPEVPRAQVCCCYNW